MLSIKIVSILDWHLHIGKLGSVNESVINKTIFYDYEQMALCNTKVLDNIAYT